MATPLPSTAASELEPFTVPTARDADVTVAVKVVLPPVIVAEGGVMTSQLCVLVGVIVILPVQAPMMLMVNL